MSKYIALIMTSGNINKNGNTLSDTCIKEIVEKTDRVPVRVAFAGDPIGSASNFILKDNKVFCTLDVKYNQLDSLGFYAVPNGIVYCDDVCKISDEVTVINHMTLLEVSIVTNPADETLVQLKKIKGEQ